MPALTYKRRSSCASFVVSLPFLQTLTNNLLTIRSTFGVGNSFGCVLVPMIVNRVVLFFGFHGHPFMSVRIKPSDVFRYTINFAVPANNPLNSSAVEL